MRRVNLTFYKTKHRHNKIDIMRDLKIFLFSVGHPYEEVALRKIIFRGDPQLSYVFLEVGRFKVLEPDGDLQNRTGCNRLSL